MNILIIIPACLPRFAFCPFVPFQDPPLAGLGRPVAALGPWGAQGVNMRVPPAYRSSKMLHIRGFCAPLELPFEQTSFPTACRLRPDTAAERVQELCP